MASHSSLQMVFPWLSPTYRPSRREVKEYAQAIRASDQEHGRVERALLKQAELQLWVWRAETRQPAPRLRRAPRTRPREEEAAISFLSSDPHLPSPAA